MHDLENSRPLCASSSRNSPTNYDSKLIQIDAQDERQLNGRRNDTTPTSDIESKRTKSMKNVADLIGEFDFYQLSLSTLAFIRYVCVAMMTNSGPLLAPKLDFQCLPPPDNDSFSIKYPTNMTNKEEFLKNKCYLDSLVNGTMKNYKCSDWQFNTTKYGTTLTDTFELICDRSWYTSAFQSTVSVGVVIASVVFGSFSDEYGRRFTMRVCCVISLIAGSISAIAPDFFTFTISRSICSMSDLGIVGSLYTIIVETLGNKYRGHVCAIVFTGWSIGVMIMPWVIGYFLDFRNVMLFTVACHAITLPWLLTVGESIRWLLVANKFGEAEQEVKRIYGWNMLFASRKSKRQSFDQVKYDFEQMKLRFVERQIRNGQNEKVNNVRSLGGFSKIGQIFKSRELTRTTLMIIWTTFNSELMYMLFIMINSDVGNNVKLNYAIGGLMEVMATLMAIIMLTSMKRKMSLSTTLTVISASIFCLAFTHANPSWSVIVLNFAKFAISTLSSLIYVIATELFPTSLRQTGIGLTATLGSLGAVVAPFIRQELKDLIGMTNVMLAIFVLPLSAALLIPSFLRETKDVELPDNVDEIDDRDDG